MSDKTFNSILQSSKVNPKDIDALDVPDYQVPSLPGYARLSDKLLAQAETAGAWLNEYKKFARKASPMTAPEYHEILGLTLAATTIARRVSLKIATKEIYPNLYSLIVGSSGDAKSEGAKLALKIGRLAGLAPFELPGYMSPQGLMQELTGKNSESLNGLADDEYKAMQTRHKFSAQRLLLLDESASLFDWFEQDGMKGLKDLLRKLYDCPPDLEEATVGRGYGIAYNPTLSLCGISTRSDMEPFLKRKAYWGNGIWARFIFVSASWDKPPYSFFPPALDIPKDIPDLLKRLAFSRLPQPQDNRKLPEITISLGQGVIDLWKAYDQATRYDFVESKDLSERYKSNYKRLPTMLIKTAMLLATLDWEGSKRPAPIIERHHFAQAYLLTEQWRASLHRLLEMPNKDGQEDSLETKAIRYIPLFESNLVITERELSQKLNLSGIDERPTLSRLIEQMIKDKLIAIKQVKHTGKDGKEYSRNGFARSQP